MKLKKAIEVVENVVGDYIELQDYPKSNFTNKKVQELVDSWNEITGHLNSFVGDGKECCCSGEKSKKKGKK